MRRAPIPHPESLMEDLGLPASPSVDIEAPSVSPRQWWSRDRLHYDGDDLVFAGHRVADLVDQYGPIMAYDTKRIRDRIQTLHGALSRTGQPRRMYYAVKANRFGPVVAAVRDTGVCGIDCCSPGEVRLALASGFRPEEISFTGCSLSHRDVAELVDLGVRINANSISMIHKLGHHGTRSAIGLRLNPQIGVGASPGLTYAGATATKFGIYPDRVEEAVRLARSYGMRIEGVHMHVGSGWLREGAATFARAVERMIAIAEPFGEDLRYVNVGGGIGVVHGPDDQAVDLDAYASVIAGTVRRSLGADVEICCEPGDFIVNDACITAATVTEVEEKGGSLFVGLDIGFNSNPQPAHYAFIPEVLSANRGPSDEDDHAYVVTGNVNEVIDVFNPEARLPSVHEGDVLTLLNTGGYSSSMQSNHCLRALPREIAF